MKALQTLHLSGNGYTGSLPNNITISKNLTDLSMSHNLLTGSIPDSFQLKRWKRIDLSFNRISGTLSSSAFSNVNMNSTIYLEENWISGRIPTGLIDVEQINILNGNIFGCSLSKWNAPRNDPHFSNYSCGSNSFEVIYYIWLGLVGSLAAIMFVWKYSNKGIRCHWNKISRLVLTISGYSNRDIVNVHATNIEMMKEELNI